MAGLRCVSKIRRDSECRHVSVFRRWEGFFKTDLVTGEKERSFPYLPAEVVAVDFSGDGSTKLVCDLSGAVVMYHNGEEVGAARERLEIDCNVHVFVTDDGDVAVSVTSNGRVDGWQRQGSEFVRFSCDLRPEPAIQFVRASSTGHRLCVVRTDGGSVSFHRSASGAMDGREFNLGSNILALDWSRDEQSIVAMTYDGLVRVYDTASGQVVHEYPLELEPRHCFGAVVSVSPDGKWIAVATDNSTEIYIGNMTSCTRVRKLVGHTGIVRTMQFSPASDRLYSGSHDGTLREWSLETHSQLRILD